jgi:Bacterial Ig-like domain/Bacterial Ig domain
MYKTPRLGLHYYWLFFGILFAIAIFSLPLMTTLLNVHQDQVMAQTLNATNNNTNASSPRVHNPPASPSTPNVSKAATTTPKSAQLIVLNFTWPIDLTKPSTIVKLPNVTPPNDRLTFHIIQNSSNGNLGNVTGKLGDFTGNSVTYTPKARFIGPDNFTYGAIDKYGLHSNNVRVTLNHPPTVKNNTISINGTKPVKVQLVGSDLDRADKLTFSLVQKPLNALLSDPSGNFSTYVPNPGFIGQDKFTYRAKDSAGLPSNIGTVAINVGKPLPTPSLNVTAPPVPTTSSVYLTTTVLIYAAIVALFMFLPLVYDMAKTYNQKGKPATEATRNGGFPDLARSLMAFGIIVILAILAFHVLVTITYSVLLPDIRNSLLDIIKNLSTILGGAVSAIIGFYFGQKTVEKSGTTVGAGATKSGGVGGGPTVVSTVPTDGSHPVPLDSKITALFSEPVSVEASSFALKDIKNNPVQGTISLSQDGITLEFKPSTNLVPSNTYIATITGVKDLAGNTMSSPKTWNVTTVSA